MSQPTLRREGEKTKMDWPKHLPPREKTREFATKVYSGKALEKPKRQRSTDFENEGSGVVYTWGRYLHPTRLSQGTTTFDRVCKT
ncbi:hypothetical protein HKD37_02G004798 [Glycine soja]